MQRRAELVEQLRPHEIGELLRRRAAARLDEAPGGIRKVLDVPVLVHEHARRRKLLEHLAVGVRGGAPQPDGAVAAALRGSEVRHCRHLRQPQQRRRRAHARAEQPMLLVHRLEQLGVGRLRHADEQMAVLARPVAEQVP